MTRRERDSLSDPGFAAFAAFAVAMTAILAAVFAFGTALPAWQQGFFFVVWFVVFAVIGDAGGIRKTGGKRRGK